MAKKYTDDELARIEEGFRKIVEDQEYAYLVADNSIATRKTLANTLTKAGCETVVEAKDGPDVVEQAAKLDGKAVVIMDMNLRNGDGIAVLKQLREVPKTAEAVVILVDTEIRKEKLVVAAKLKASGFLKKPIDPNAVLEKLRELDAI